jgi:hypothetical protein
MRGKLLFLTGAAVGYILGARAGRRRYEQIKAAASKVWESPGIQQQVHQAQDFAAAKLGDVPGAVIEGAKKVISKSNASRSASTSNDSDEATIEGPTGVA